MQPGGPAAAGLDQRVEVIARIGCLQVPQHALLEGCQFGHGAQQRVRRAIVPREVEGVGDQQVVGFGNGIGHHGLQGEEHAPVKAPHLQIARRLLIVHADVAAAQAPDAKVKGLRIEDRHHQVFEHDRLARRQGDGVSGQGAEIDLDVVVASLGAKDGVQRGDAVVGRLLGHDLEAGDVVGDPVDLGVSGGLGLVLHGQPHPEVVALPGDLPGHVEDRLAHDLVDINGGLVLVLSAGGIDGAGNHRSLGSGKAAQIQGVVVPEVAAGGRIGGFYDLVVNQEIDMMHGLLHILAVRLHEDRSLDRDPVTLKVVLGGEHDKVDLFTGRHSIAVDINGQLGRREGDLDLGGGALVGHIKDLLLDVHSTFQVPRLGFEGVYLRVELLTGQAQRVGGDDTLVFAPGLGIVGVHQFPVQVEFDPLDIRGVGIIGAHGIDVGVALDGGNQHGRKGRVGGVDGQCLKVVVAADRLQPVGIGRQHTEMVGGGWGEVLQAKAVVCAVFGIEMEGTVLPRQGTILDAAVAGIVRGPHDGGLGYAGGELDVRDGGRLLVAEPGLLAGIVGLVFLVGLLVRVRVDAQGVLVVGAVVGIGEGPVHGLPRGQRHLEPIIADRYSVDAEQGSVAGRDGELAGVGDLVPDGVAILPQVGDHQVRQGRLLDGNLAHRLQDAAAAVDGDGQGMGTGDIRRDGDDALGGNHNVVNLLPTGRLPDEGERHRRRGRRDGGGKGVPCTQDHVPGAVDVKDFGGRAGL